MNTVPGVPGANWTDGGYRGGWKTGGWNDGHVVLLTVFSRLESLASNFCKYWRIAGGIVSLEAAFACCAGTYPVAVPYGGSVSRSVLMEDIDEPSCAPMWLTNSCKTD